MVASTTYTAGSPIGNTSGDGATSKDGTTSEEAASSLAMAFVDMACNMAT